MDPVSQATLGMALPQSTLKHEHLAKLVLCGALAGMAPDLDVLITSSTDPLLSFDYHRHFTHSLFFIPIGALLVATPMFWILRRAVEFKFVYLACFLGYATHGVLDACTSYGTYLYWPFSNYRVSWNYVSTIDPAFTIPLLALVISGLIWRYRMFPVLGLIWAVTYIAFGALQGQRAQDASEILIRNLNHEPSMQTIKTSVANLLVWKVIYRYEDNFYVHGIRISVDGQATVCGEPSRAERVNVNKHFPWLEESQQQTDLERFSRFSQDYIGIDPENPMQVIDVRYSNLPNEVKPLWGIRLDPNASFDAHAAFFTNRSLVAEVWGTFWTYVNGSACRPLTDSSLNDVRPG